MEGVEFHKPAKLSNVDTIQTTHPDGMQSYRLDPMDITRVDVILMDNLGRRKPMSVYQSTMLVMVPVGDFGAQPFDPCGARDDDNKPIFLQRAIVDRTEIVQLAIGAVTKQFGMITKQGNGFRPPRM
jgi:hypothetical protein